MPDRLNWGVIGTGGIANDFAYALQSSTRCQVTNVCGSSPEKAREFAARYGLPAAAESLEQLLKDPQVQAVYVATPHPSHERLASAAVAAGKHVLCEKPLCIDAAGTERLIASAAAHRVFLMEAFMYRCHPALRELVKRLENGVIGAIRHVRADFGFAVPRDARSRLFAPELGGGAILDVGCYTLSFARLIAGIATGQRYAEPDSLRGAGVIGPTGVDELASAVLGFPGGITASIATSIRHGLGTRCSIFGEAGRIDLPNPWMPGGQRHGLDSNFDIFVDGRELERVHVHTELSPYALEAELVADSLPATEAAWPAMTWGDSMGNMRALDAWRAALSADTRRPNHQEIP
jgi:predicted dehydrogenase